MRRTGIFDNAVTGVHEIRDPQTQELVGWNFTIVDQDDGTTYEVPMTVDLAQKHATRIMGIGKVTVPKVIEDIQRRTGGKR